MAFRFIFEKLCRSNNYDDLVVFINKINEKSTTFLRDVDGLQYLVKCDNAFKAIELLLSSGWGLSYNAIANTIINNKLEYLELFPFYEKPSIDKEGNQVYLFDRTAIIIAILEDCIDFVKIIQENWGIDIERDTQIVIYFLKHKNDKALDKIFADDLLKINNTKCLEWIDENPESECYSFLFNKTYLV